MVPAWYVAQCGHRPRSLIRPTHRYAGRSPHRDSASGGRGRGLARTGRTALRGSAWGRPRRHRVPDAARGLKLLLDHNLAPRIARCLQALFIKEHEIVALGERFPVDVSDVDLIKA